MIYKEQLAIIKGQHVVTLRTTESRPKMSMLLTIPKGIVLKVTEVFRTDRHEHYRGLDCKYVLMCYNPDYFHHPFPIKSNDVTIADEVSKLLYASN